MGSSMILAAMTRKKFIFLLCCMFARVNSQVDQTQTGTPLTGMLCISECETCPVLCSPPPSPINKKPPPTPETATSVPPPKHYPPPETYYFDTPPPAPKALSQPPPKASHSYPPPPPAYMVYSGMPPPPSNNIGSIPSVQFPPGLVSPNNNNPYYYFSSSKASIPQQGVSVFMSLLAFQALYYYTFYICF